jgi:hypothetical protein
MLLRLHNPVESSLRNRLLACYPIEYAAHMLEEEKEEKRCKPKALERGGKDFPAHMIQDAQIRWSIAPEGPNIEPGSHIEQISLLPPL